MKENYEELTMDVIAFDKDIWTEDGVELVQVSAPADEELMVK